MKSSSNFVRFLSASGSITHATYSSAPRYGGERSPYRHLSRVRNIEVLASSKPAPPPKKSTPRRTFVVRGEIFGLPVTPTLENQKRLRALGNPLRRLLHSPATHKLLEWVGARHARP